MPSSRIPGKANHRSKCRSLNNKVEMGNLLLRSDFRSLVELWTIATQR